MKLQIALTRNPDPNVLPDFDNLLAWHGHIRPHSGCRARCGSINYGCDWCIAERQMVDARLSDAPPLPDLNDLNAWHGHVRPRTDGTTMRCGGYRPEGRCCSICRIEKELLTTTNAKGNEMKLQIALSGKDAYDMSKVKKKARKKIGELFNGLREEAAKALLAGETIPDFDLCSITVPGTNLFCQGNKGLPRSVMPQLKGFPEPDSPAADMPVDKNGKVDVSQSFLDMLTERGIKFRRYRINPAKLKATQNQLVGSKIAINVGKMDTNPNHKKFNMPYFISKDGYILDGHHGWAAVMGHNLLNKTNLKINVIEVDLKIRKLVNLTNAFVKEMGIAPKTGETN